MYDKLVKIPLLSRLARIYAQKRAPVYFISFPKCGRTWVRVMLGKVLQEHFDDRDVPLLDLVEPKHRRPGFPGIKWVHDDSVHWKKPGELAETKDNYRYKKVVFLVRDPRDVLVSLYFEKHNRLKAYAGGEKKQYRDVEDRVKPFEGDLSEYLRQPVGGFDTILRFYRIWEQNRDVPGRFLLMRYEDIHEDTPRELRRIVDFLDLEGVGGDLIEEAVRFAAFEKMRKMEKEDKFGSTSMRPADVGDPESFKTRKGKVGGYVEYMTADEIRELTDRMNDVLAGTFGYGSGS